MAFNTFSEARKIAIDRAKVKGKIYVVIYDDIDEYGESDNPSPYYVNTEDNWYTQPEDGGPDFSSSARLIFRTDGHFKDYVREDN